MITTQGSEFDRRGAGNALANVSFCTYYFVQGMNSRESLIQSAQELLWERGYVGMSPKAIQERSGAGQGSMYHHFKGKADLAAEAIEQSAASFRDGADKWLSASGTPLERIRGYMLRSREVLKGCQIGKLTQDPEIAADPDLRRPIDQTFERLDDRPPQHMRGPLTLHHPTFDCGDYTVAKRVVVAGVDDRR
ncbi:MAG TPA: TetR/AcrR family transcriptional regulator [Acidobacteriaceae bacterium]|nr:TetR/AcrR family transcriptional regulator [Acidobacteriaceae bacterium]